MGLTERSSALTESERTYGKEASQSGHVCLVCWLHFQSAASAPNRVLSRLAAYCISREARGQHGRVCGRFSRRFDGRDDKNVEVELPPAHRPKACSSVMRQRCFRGCSIVCSNRRPRVCPDGPMMEGLSISLPTARFSNGLRRPRSCASDITS
jgi:hypothetical protein